MKHKKAEATSGLIVLATGVGIALMVIILISSLGGQAYNIVEPDLNTIGVLVQVTNYSFTASNETATWIGHSFIESGTLSFGNISASVSNDNFTIDYDAGTALYKSATNHNGLVLNATYQYHNETIRNSVKNSIVSSFEALETTSGYMPLIVTAIVLIFVLSMIIGLSTGKSGGNMGGNNSAL